MIYMSPRYTCHSEEGEHERECKTNGARSRRVIFSAGKSPREAAAGRNKRTRRASRSRVTKIFPRCGNIWIARTNMANGRTNGRMDYGKTGFYHSARSFDRPRRNAVCGDTVPQLTYRDVRRARSLPIPSPIPAGFLPVPFSAIPRPYRGANGGARFHPYPVSKSRARIGSPSFPPPLFTRDAAAAARTASVPQRMRFFRGTDGPANLPRVIPACAAVPNARRGDSRYLATAISNAD